MLPGDLVRTCPHCSAGHAAFQRVFDTGTTGPAGQDRRWVIASCPACGGLLNFEVPPGVPAEAPVLRVVPEVSGDWEVGHLPADIERDWNEAVAVFRVHAESSAVVMCGRTLEAAANRLGIDGRTLQDRIRVMLDQGLVTQRLGQAMNYVRLIRNTGAHAGTEVSRESAEGTMRFTQQTLRLLFEVPGELDRLEGTPPELGQSSQDADTVEGVS